MTGTEIVTRRLRMKPTTWMRQWTGHVGGGEREEKGEGNTDPRRKML
jgi:hypothetical protein